MDRVLSREAISYRDISSISNSDIFYSKTHLQRMYRPCARSTHVQRSFLRWWNLATEESESECTGERFRETFLCNESKEIVRAFIRFDKASFSILNDYHVLITDQITRNESSRTRWCRECREKERLRIDRNRTRSLWRVWDARSRF